jgi:streptomycin 6-kinase
VMAVFADNIASIHGEVGRKWLQKLDGIVADLAKKWNLINLEPFDNLTFNYVSHGFQSDAPIVLKIGIRHENLEKEAKALRFFKNYGAVELIDSSKGALLLRRAVPGNSLMEYFPDRENESMRIAAKVIQKLHSTNRVSDDFFRIEDLTSVFYEQWDIPENYISKARRVAERLLKTTTKQVAMHGDLHHDNIVKDGDEWKVIDPTGVIGDPVYEIASFMINPIDKIWKHENAMSIVKNRIDAFSKLLNIDPDRVAQWTFVKSTLCWIWTLETPNQDRSQLVKLFDRIVED